jgi:hypothetical protein
VRQQKLWFAYWFRVVDATSPMSLDFGVYHLYKLALIVVGYCRSFKKLNSLFLQSLILWRGEINFLTIIRTADDFTKRST